MASGFVISGKKNIINNYEINSVVQELINKYPEYEIFIRSNIRNYFMKRMPCMVVNELMGHANYKAFTLRNELNPEIEVSKLKGNFEFHQIAISQSILNQIRNSLEFMKFSRISPKASFNVDNLCRRADAWTKRMNALKETVEGKIEVILTIDLKHQWVLLKDHQAFRRESAMMMNCVKTLYTDSKLGNVKIYSLRDMNNKPLVTMEVRKSLITQIKSAANKEPKKFEKQIQIFKEQMNLGVQLTLEDFNLYMTEYLPYTEREDLPKNSFWDFIKNLMGI